MQQAAFTILANIPIAKNVFEMTLRGDTSGITAPGQFVQIALDGFYLRRPISVCCVSGDVLTLVYKTVGSGTAAMSSMTPGQTLELLTGLGNGYDLTLAGSRPLLLGGGVGVPPLYLLAQQLCGQGASPVVILGFNTADEVFYADKFAALCETHVVTADGSMGTKGFVTALIPAVGDYTHFYACGPEPMLRAVSEAAVTSGQLSFEERMACGFGACMGCTCETKYGHKRICKDGPVLMKEEVIW